jgi:hypothetical protein
VADLRALREALRPPVPVEVVLLLPRLSRGARAVGVDPAWGAELRRWGAPDAAAAVVAADVRAAASSGADHVLLLGRDRRRRLQRAGYVTRTWSVRRAPAGATAVLPDGDAALDALARALPPRPSLRSLVVLILRRALPARGVVVAGREDVAAELPVLSGAQGRVGLVTGGAGPRRRSVLVVGHAGRPTHVVKVEPAGGDDRAEREQAVLAVLAELGGDHVPAPLGHGQVGGVRWCAETAVPGVPLSQVLGGRPRPDMVRQLLSELFSWSASLGAATARPRTWSDSDAASLPLAGPHTRLAGRLGDLRGVAGVLAHRDLASAHNVLVDGRRWAVIDWETARESLPLVDALPLGCAVLAAAHGARTPHEVALATLDLCRGRHAASEHLLEEVRRYLARLSVAGGAAGTLACLAFAQAASLRLEHQELLRRSRPDATADWTTPWDTVVQRWADTPGLGHRWQALGLGP